MKWQPFIQFRTGHKQESWDRLTAEEQKAVYKASGKQRKTKVPVAEDQDDPTFVEEPSDLPVRVVSKEEFSQMPVYRRF